MKPEQNHKEAEILAARARITVPAERLNSLTAGLALTKQLFSERLLKHDLGATEPASRFRAPPP